PVMQHSGKMIRRAFRWAAYSTKDSILRKLASLSPGKLSNCTEATAGFVCRRGRLSYVLQRRIHVGYSSTAHAFTVPSAQPAAIVRPSGEQATLKTSPLVANVCRNRNLAVSQTLT